MEQKIRTFKRRTMLYIPGNNPAMLQQGSVYGADGVLLDLEDAVALNQKDAARILVSHMLQYVSYEGCEVTVRVNHIDTPFGEEDLKQIVPLQPDAIRLPKVETIDEISRIIQLVEDIENAHELPHDKMKIHVMIETALGVQNVYDIANYSSRIDAISIGGQDLAADMQLVKTNDGIGIDYARKQIVMAAKACKIDVFDTVYVDVENEEGLREEAEYIKKLGFTGKAIINPRQIEIVNEVFTPTEKEIRKAAKIVKAFERNKKEGIGVFAVDGKMVDAPVVQRALRVLEMADIDVADI
ncbi:HpcH/HpaI aldolase/citrate lyase family protein [Carboxylicivirga linearis]|uniref:HpcH/HpaI aldolase/citrate lyase family protein n=1 Tax=Carboxylicivirga linearis TaxID=1628157 RepID=A0ABS5JZ33_9BACT|nr:aldolase/citrate lyase family protein [Carboxylicivirga linearis]MBS2100099.1 HpcH/HpaI aldolase/citrate lyase family protein [Carboxylicivirga linearis]